jgi:hypothetical protein
MKTADFDPALLVAVQDGALQREARNFFGQRTEALGPVKATPCVKPRISVANMRLDPVSVVFDLVVPGRSIRWGVAQRSEAGSI